MTPTLLLASPLQIGELVTWDVNEIVDLDVPGQGMKQVQLTFNISEDVDDITNRFMTMNKLDRHFRDQVREMIASVRHRSACLSVLWPGGLTMLACTQTWKARGGTYTKATAVTVTRMTYFPQVCTQRLHVLCCCGSQTHSSWRHTAWVCAHHQGQTGQGSGGTAGSQPESGCSGGM